MLNLHTKSCKSKKSAILLILLISINLLLFSMDFSKPGLMGAKSTETATNINPEGHDDLKNSAFGYAPWWNDSYAHRMMINITNPYDYSFNNFGVSLSFNYANLVQEGKVQSDLDDLRIVENSILRDYYIKKDYPSPNMVTIWFDTNVSANSIESDTYLYFGNPLAINHEAESPSQSFGWIKNGDFELDVNSDSKFVPYGWNFSDNPVNEIMGIANPYPSAYNSSETSYEFFVNKLVSNPQGAERVAQGTYSYKFGALSPTLPDGAVNDYAGTFFSYPFTVPIVNDGGKISLSFYRNIRTYRFERPKNMGQINPDGYFIRILNGTSNYVENPDNQVDSAISPTYQNYIEAYQGYAYYNNPAKKWTGETLLTDFPDHSIINDTLSDTGLNGDLTGYVQFDLTSYMGKTIYFELGVWGDESNAAKKEKSAFFQIDDVGFNYSLSASINEIQDRTSDITITTRDIDGRVVPNVEVFVVNDSARGTGDFIVASGWSSSIDGTITFENLLNGVYNITANYMLGGVDYELYNSTKLGVITYNLTGKAYDFDISLDLWTIDFEITDWDGIPLNYGFINVSDQKGGTVLKTLTLNDEGKATFRWQTAADFYYQVYYKNNDYSGSPFLLNESYIYRSDYLSRKFQSYNISINDLNIAPKTASRYEIQEKIYSGGTDVFSNEKIIKANVTLTNLNDQISNISIYYIDKENSTGNGDENLILFKNNYEFATQNDSFSLDISKLTNQKLISEFYDVRGLFLIINGRNNTKCNGFVSIQLIETTNIKNITALTRLEIRVININDLFPGGAPIDSLIKVSYNNNQALINLTSIATRDGYAYGESNGYDIPFWFMRGETFNFSIDVLNVTDAYFNVTFMNPDDQWKPTSNSGVKYYNYTLYEAAMITFNIIFAKSVNITNYDTSFFNSTGTLQATWGDYLNYSIDFYHTEDGGVSWAPITGTTSTCSIEITAPGESEILFKSKMTSHLNGTYTIQIDSKLLSAGYSYRYYSISIIGSKPGYPPPNRENFLLKLNTVKTEMTLHNYDSLEIVEDQAIQAYYDEPINITVRYFVPSPELSLESALISYEWIGLTPSTINVDPINPGYFTFTLNTFDAQTIGIKIISITALYENYSKIENFLIYLDVLPRLTTIDGNENLEYINKQMWVQDTQLFTFNYEDLLRSNTVGDLDVATYIWQQVDSLGNIIEGRDGSGILHENTNKTYTLDFNTGIRQPGYYILYITLQKENYETRSALINLQIKLREFEYSLNGSNIQNNQLSVVQGKDLEIKVNLIDISRQDINLENASVYLQMQGNLYEFSETSTGEYSYVLKTTNIDAFFISQIYSAKVIIQKDNFTTQEIPITITIKMEEIFPGMPTFYFILIIGSVVGILTSVGIYRGVQQARIPKHVKRIRKVKKIIKSKKSISEISAPTKQKMLVKLFGTEWKAIGLSMEDSLDLPVRKLKEEPKQKSTEGDMK